MPTYTFRNTKTEEVFEKFMSISAREAFLEANPEITTVIGAPATISGVDNSSGGRLPSGFKDVLKTMKAKHPKARGLDHIV